MGRWRVSMLVAVALAAVLAGGCGFGDGLYDRLSDVQMRYVIPGSDDWGSGELCPDGGSCSGPITDDGIARLDWYRIAAIDFPRDPNNVPRSYATRVTATLSVIEAYPTPQSGRDLVSVAVWKPDAPEVSDVVDEGFDVWVGVDLNRARVFAAFDAEGRVGGVGHAMAQYFTIPVAQFSAAAGAPSAFEYLEPIMSE